MRHVAEANNCVPHNMLQVLNAPRHAGLRVFYSLHHRYRPGDYETSKYIAPIQKTNLSTQSFEDGTWGGEIHSEFKPQPGETVAQEHWCSGDSATQTYLLLKKYVIHRVIIIEMIATTCVESTVMHSAIDINLPNYANAIVTTKELVEWISSFSTIAISA
jgi:ureidoacrylate peracid hydrolase